MATIYYDSDADFDLLKERVVSVIGYGSQGHAQALNLKESGANVIVGLRPSSKSVDEAKANGLTVKSVEEAAAEGEEAAAEGEEPAAKLWCAACPLGRNFCVHCEKRVPRNLFLSTTCSGGARWNTLHGLA